MKRAISLMFLSFVLLWSVNATTLSTSYINLSSDPVKYANIIAAGALVEDSSGHQFLISEKNWTKNTTKIYVPPSFDFNDRYEKKRGIVSKKYFLYMTEEPRFVNDRNKDPYKYTGPIVLESLQNAKVTIEKFSEKKDFIGEINPSWQFCESDKECIKDKKSCGRSIGVNKKYQKDYLEFLKSNKVD